MNKKKRWFKPEEWSHKKTKADKPEQIIRRNNLWVPQTMPIGDNK